MKLKLLSFLFLIAALVIYPINAYSATFQIRVLTSAALPDTSGNTWFAPATISQPTNDRFPQLVTHFRDSGTKTGVGTNFTIPQNYASGGTFVIVWASTATSGAVVWDVDYKAIAASGESLDPATDDETLTATTTTNGTTQLSNSSSVVCSTCGFAAGDVVQVTISRDGANGSDTMGADAVAYAIIFQYTGT